MPRGWLLLLILLLSAALPAMAGESLGDLVKRMEKPGTLSTEKFDKNGALRLTSNKNAILRLDQDAASVIVNNPDTASVMLDSPRLLIVMPRQPGTTSFTVLNAKGEVALQKDVIVSNVQPQYVRIRRMCSGNDASCMPAAYYYCPDGCYEVSPVSANGTASVPPPAAAAATAVNAAASMAPAPTPEAAAPEEEAR